MGKWLARAHAIAAQSIPASDVAPPTATLEQAAELRTLVALILADDTQADRDEALTVVLGDPEAALVSFRAMAVNLQPYPLPFPDDRRTCQQCGNLTQGGRCRAAARGELPDMPRRMYSPAPAVLRRCEGFVRTLH